ncbi:MAG TPA: hypothetical protein PLN21_14055 [Gemmatales bacterium]|nr:hypothetical protein [Gemmatales bacterium]
MPLPVVYLHYFNANVEGRLPHALEFGSLYGRLATNENIKGQVVTVVSYGSPRHYFVWSTFDASLSVQEYKGKHVIQGHGWHLCPPREVPVTNIDYLTDSRLLKHLFIEVAEERFAKWLLAIVVKYKPPGDPSKIKSFLTHLWKHAGNELIEQKANRLLKTIKFPKGTK